MPWHHYGHWRTISCPCKYCNFICYTYIIYCKVRNRSLAFAIVPEEGMTFVYRMRMWPRLRSRFLVIGSKNSVCTLTFFVRTLKLKNKRFRVKSSPGITVQNYQLLFIYLGFWRILFSLQLWYALLSLIKLSTYSVFKAALLL